MTSTSNRLPVPSSGAPVTHGVGYPALQGPSHDLAAENAALLSQVENLQKALVSSRRIGAAIGIFMATDRCTYDHAVEVLMRTSQDLNRKLRDIAEDVIRTGLPPAPESRTIRVGTLGPTVETRREFS